MEVAGKLILDDMVLKGAVEQFPSEPVAAEVLATADLTTVANEAALLINPTIDQFIEDNAPAPINTANTIKTGQTSSFAANDDGDTQRGRGVDFFTLDWINPFGNNQRFTGITGGYYDQDTLDWKDKDGVVTTEALAIPNDIVLDWNQADARNKKVFALHRIQQTGDWFTANALNGVTSYGGFDDWFLWNRKEMEQFLWENNPSSNCFTYPPLNASVGNGLTWCSTSYKLNEAHALRAQQGSLISNRVKSDTVGMYFFPSRIFTYAELGV